MANIENGHEIELLTLEGESKTARTLITTGSNDPSTGAGETAPVGSIFLRQVTATDGKVYVKTGSSDTNWELIRTGTLSTNNVSTGLFFGGKITINTGDNTKFDVTAGAGLIVDNYTDPQNPTYQVITWPNYTAVQSLYYNVSQRSFIAINSSGNIIQKTSKYTTQETRDNIVLGLLGHTTLTNIINTRHNPNAVFDPTARLTDLANGIGPFNISGNVYSPNGINLKLNKTSGFIHRIGTNFQNDKKSPDIDESVSETISQFRYSYKNGTGGFTVLGTTTDINPNFWDNGSGTLQTVPPNFWTIQIIKYMSGSAAGTPTARIEYSQIIFPTKESALYVLPTPSHDHNPAFVDGTIRLFLVVKAGATDLTDTNQAIFYEVGKFYDTINTPNVFPTLNSVYLNSATPEITTDITRGALSIKEGSGVGGNLIEGYNSASTLVYNVDVSGNLTLNGLIDGRDVSVDGTILDNLGIEVNSIETSVGTIINGVGAWLGFSGTNLLNSSTSIKNAFEILDNNTYGPVISRNNGVVVQTFTNPTALFFGTSTRQDSDYSYNNGIVVSTISSWYIILVNASYTNTTGNRTTSETYVRVNGIEVPGTKAYGYHRSAADGQQTLCICSIIYLNSGEQLEIVGRRFSGTGTLQTLPNACRLNLKRIL